MTFWVAGAAIGGSLLSGALASNSADKAVGAQTDAANQSDATQRYMYDTTRADYAPFRDTGLAANNQLAYLMGLGGGSQTGYSPTQSYSQPGGMTAEQWRNQLLGQYTTTTPGTQGTWQMNGGGVDMGDTFIPGTPGGTSIDEAGLNAAIQQRMQQQQSQSGNQALADGGYGAGNTGSAYGSLMRKFSAADMAADPVYNSGLQFGLDQGTQGINRQAAANGSYLSGATLKALTRFGNDYGSTKANESYNRYNNDINSQYNKLAGISGAGQQATNQIGNATQNLSNNLASSQQGVGNARASGYLAQGNAWQNALNSGVSTLKNAYQPNALNSIYGGGYGTLDGTYDYTPTANRIGMV